MSRYAGEGSWWIEEGSLEETGWVWKISPVSLWWQYGWKRFSRCCEKVQICMQTQWNSWNSGPYLWLERLFMTLKSSKRDTIQTLALQIRKLTVKVRHMTCMHPGNQVPHTICHSLWSQPSPSLSLSSSFPVPLSPLFKDVFRSSFVFFFIIFAPPAHFLGFLPFSSFYLSLSLIPPSPRRWLYFQVFMC